MTLRRLGPRCLFTGILASLVAAASSLEPREAHAAFTGLTRVASGLNLPAFTTHAPGDPNRLFIATLGSPSGSSAATATIRVLDLATGTLQTTPYLSIPGLNTNSEGGLLGLAFHPDFQTNRKFYVNVTANDSDPNSAFSTYIREYTAPSPTSPTANTTFTTVMQFTQPQANHNGGWIGFSPNDGYLYIASGDGGGGNDVGTGHTEPGGNAQDITNNLLGKMLRVDVNRDDFPTDSNRNYGIPYDIREPGGPIAIHGNPFAPDAPGGADPVGDNEIWAYGLRNPFRAGFDRVTGDLWIGDVGQQAREEIDFQPGMSDGGENYGWRLREGLIATPGSVGGARPAGNVDPVWDYKRPSDPTANPNFTGTTVTGGLPYRGPDPTLQGVYFFADYNTNRIWTLRRDGDGVDVDYVSPQLPPNTGSPSGPVAFGEDAVGNLYITYLNSGSVYRINTNQFTPADFNGDAVVDAEDLGIWKNNFGASSGATRATGDADGDADVDGADFLAWQRNLGRSPMNPGSAASGGAIPEPASCALAAMAVLAAIAGRPRKGI